MAQTQIAVVVPCLNEERSLKATCRSLGFGSRQSPPPNSSLILVDNGSEDSTIAIAHEIQRVCPPGSVLVASESERGYVPPRHTGNLLAISIAKGRGVEPEDLIILQADADTAYSENYIERVGETARRFGPGTLIDARVEPEDEFRDKHASYFDFCNLIDNASDLVFAPPTDDVIVDDKACGYWASDYLLWGGHCREFRTDGQEIHAETSRLFVRAKTFNAQRQLCEDAVAKHSGRKTLLDVGYDFATAGFPREPSFRERWAECYRGSSDIESFLDIANQSQLSVAIQSRRSHLKGLFFTLSEHVRAAVRSSAISDSSVVGSAELPTRNSCDARMRPGMLFEDVFNKVDREIFS